MPTLHFLTPFRAQERLTWLPASCHSHLNNTWNQAGQHAHSQAPGTAVVMRGPWHQPFLGVSICLYASASVDAVYISPPSKGQMCHVKVLRRSASGLICCCTPAFWLFSCPALNFPVSLPAPSSPIHTGLPSPSPSSQISSRDASRASL